MQFKDADPDPFSDTFYSSLSSLVALITERCVVMQPSSCVDLSAFGSMQELSDKYIILKKGQYRVKKGDQPVTTITLSAIRCDTMYTVV